MFDRVTDGINGIFRKLSGQGAISEANVREAMEDVRTALLEADVHYEVVNSFCEAVVADAVGREVTKSLKPGQEMIGIVHRRLVELLGGEVEQGGEGEDGDDDGGLAAMMGLPRAAKSEHPGILKISPGPTVIMMCGLQGSGKTTTCGKLAAHLKKKGRSVMLCAADLQRPAAVEQLETVAKTADELVSSGPAVRFYGEPDKSAAYGKAVNVAVQVCQRGLEAARKAGCDVLILDTAGRLHVNDELMGELHLVARTLTPHHIFLVVDAMTGQDAVNSAKAFHQRLTVDGVILTKFDSDTRGGAALSVKSVTGAPIRYIGVGEKIDALEEFYPQRIAGRILGMGDVVSLVEKAQQEVDEDEAEKLQAKMMKGEMGMDDFLRQLRTLRKMGPLKQLLGMLPGMGAMLKDVDIDDGQLTKVEAIIQSMTPAERRTPGVINPSRRRRIASGSASDPNAVGQLVKQFETVNKLTKQMSAMGASGRMGAMRNLSGGGMGELAGAMGGLRLKGSTVVEKRGVKQRKKKSR